MITCPAPRSFPFARFCVVPCLLLALSLSGRAALPAGFRALEESEYHAAGIDRRELDLEMEYPAGPKNRGIGEGWAVVSVTVDAQGHATDPFLVACSDKDFGQALLESVPSLKFQPARYRGVTVPGSCEVGYQFRYRSGGRGQHGFGFSAWGTSTGGMQVGGPLEVTSFNLFSGRKMKQEPAYAAVAEKTLDRPLEFTDVALPKLPAGYAAPGNGPVKVFVSFYIDETGKVHAPRVESAVAPELVASALMAVRTWSFQPPLAHGKPVLVQTARSVGFLPRTN